MTVTARVVLLTLLALVAVVPAAQATTSASFAGGVVTLTNDGSANETYGIAIDRDVNPATIAVTATAAIAAPTPAGSNCLLTNAARTLTCTTDDVNAVTVNGGPGADAFTVSGTDAYQYNTPQLRLHGDAGADTFTAGAGSALRSTIDGGADGDVFNGSDERRDVFTAEPGNDVYNGGTAAVAAGFDPVTYQVTQVADSFRAQQELASLRADEPVDLSLDGVANDLDGQGGTDDLRGIESLSGSDSGDKLTAGAAPAELEGNSGDDVLTGGPADDLLGGDQGNDVLRGGGGADEIHDGDYDDFYRLETDVPGPTGNDAIDGGDGDDAITYGAGKDVVAGGPGVDTAFFSRVETQVLPAYPDTEPVPRYAPVTLSLDDQANDGTAGEGDDLRSDVENIDTSATSRGQLVARLESPYSSRSADTVIGSDAANRITTGGGNDVVDGRGGADVLDVGSGDDQVNALDKATDLVPCGAGVDAVVADLPGTNPSRADVLSGCETVTGAGLGPEGGALPGTPALPAVPKLTFRKAKAVKVKAFLKRYAIGVPITTDQRSTVTGELTMTGAKAAKVGALTIGSGSLKAGTGRRTLTLKVAKQYRKALKRKLRTRKQRKKGLKLTAVVTVRNAAGQTRTARKVVRVRG